MRQPSRATSPNDARNPSPGPRRLRKAPPRVTLSPGSGLLVPVLVGWEQSTKDGDPAPARQAKIDDRSGNVIENKGRLWEPAGTCREETKATATGPYDNLSVLALQKELD
jgi:hypothetical protein